MRKLKKLIFVFFLVLFLMMSINLVQAETNNYGSLLSLNNSNQFAGILLSTTDTWKDQYNFLSYFRNMKTGDFNGDGKDEILVSSSAGITILKKAGESLISIMSAPNDTWFGNWRFNGSVNSGYDMISGIGDFNGDNKDDIFIKSDWGIGILTLDGNSLKSIAMTSHGSKAGDWTVSISDNRFDEIGDFNGDKKDEILVTSNWGYGILALDGTAITSQVCQPNGTFFGEWNSNTKDNYIKGSGDFDKDGKDEIVVTSPWGIGILKQTSNNLNTIMIAPNDTWFGDWRYNASVNEGHDEICAVNDFNGDGQAEILLKSSWGIGILSYAEGTLNSILAKENGVRFGDWLLDTKENIVESCADFNADGKIDILISSPWGIGILNMEGSQLNSLDLKEYSSNINNWKIMSGNKLRCFGDFDGNGRAQIFISKTADEIDLRDTINKRDIKIRNQGGRPTCSVFTMTFLLDYLYTNIFNTSYNDLSEEYLNHAGNKATNRNDDGDFFSNIAAGYENYGIAKESSWPYNKDAVYNYADFEAKMTNTIIDEGKSMLSNVFKLSGRFIKPNDDTVGLSDEQFNQIINSLDSGIPVGVGRGHSLPIVGYVKNPFEDGGGHFILRNSYGEASDINGYLTESFKSLKDTANDVYVYEDPQTKEIPFLPYDKNKDHLIMQKIILKIGSPTININGEVKEIDPGVGTAPVIINERTMLPIRTIIENLGGTITWDPQIQKVTIILNENKIELFINNKSAKVNDKDVLIDVAPTIINSRTFIPLRFVIENLAGYSISWDDKTKSIAIEN